MSEENKDFTEKTIEEDSSGSVDIPEVNIPEVNVPDIESNDSSKAEDAAEDNTLNNEYTEEAFNDKDINYKWSYESQLEYEKKNEKKKGRKGALVYAVIVTALFAICFLILAALLIYGTYNGFGKRETVYVDKVVYVHEDVSSSGMLSTQEIADKVIPSTVGVVVTKKTTAGTSQGTGTGIVLDKEGYIVTNHHVIDSAVSITVIMSDTTEFEAELIGSDEDSDVAVLKIVPGLYELTPAEFADSSLVFVGDSVIAIGNAGGMDLFGTVTKGVISGVNRDIKFYDSNDLVQKRMTLLQTDALINPGNSGGPLVDMYGKVIGINFMKYVNEEFEGLGFALPSNGVLEIIKEIKETGHYSGNAVAEKGVSLGISGMAVSEGDLVEELKIVCGASGIIVATITDENSSVYGYLEVGDIITGINGKTMTDITQIRTILAKCKVGDKITITVYRDGATLDIEVPLK